eukprot:2206766-Amphidinium_carterae.3
MPPPEHLAARPERLQGAHSPCEVFQYICSLPLRWWGFLVVCAHNNCMVAEEDAAKHEFTTPGLYVTEHWNTAPPTTYLNSSKCSNVLS